MADKSKKIWEFLRRDETTTEVRVKLCGELMKLIEGNVKFLSMAHDTTRVLECLIQLVMNNKNNTFLNKFKVRKQQMPFLKEVYILNVVEDIPTMSKSLYAHHVIIKFLTHG